MKRIFALLLALGIAGMLLAGCVQTPAAPSGAGTGSGKAAGAAASGAGTQQAAAGNGTQGTGAGAQNTDAGAQQGAAAQQGAGTQAGSGAGSPAAAWDAGLSKKKLTLATSDSWKINATLYYAQDSKPKRAVLLLPMAGETRESYAPLIPGLHDALPDADIVALDMRGHGESANLGTYGGFMDGDWKAMNRDIEATVKWFGFYRDSVTEFYIVGASIGSTAAIRYAATDASVTRVVMLSPGISYHNIDITNDVKLYNKRLYLVASQGDTYSKESMDALYSESPSSAKQKYTYTTIGAAHGTGMFNASAASSEGALATKVAGWLKEA